MKGNLHSYPSIYAIGHPAVGQLFNGPVLVEEKVDGSQFSFGIHDNNLCMRSKGAEVYAESPGMFAAAVATVKELVPIMHHGWTYRCEYLAKPKHNVLAYERVPVKHLILFDINTGEETYISYGDKAAEAARLGLEVVPVILSDAEVTSSEKLFELVDRDSILGGKVEGIVVKNYAQFGKDKKVLMGKFVSERFKESHSKEWKASNPTLSDVVDRVIATLKTEARWQKAVQHLNDAGQLEHSPKDIGALIAEVRADVLREEKEFIKEKLYEWSKERIARSVAAGFPEWYKRKLVEEQFG